MMQKLAIIIFIATLGFTRSKEKAPDFMKGNFMDDYEIRYTINDSVWVQYPNTRFHIIKWNAQEQYLIARNDASNPGDANLYTRIDYMEFKNMAPYQWGYCLTAYNAKSDAEAEATIAADRANPKKGCNGFPFSRMRVMK